MYIHTCTCMYVHVLECLCALLVQRLLVLSSQCPSHQCPDWFLVNMLHINYYSGGVCVFVCVFVFLQPPHGFEVDGSCRQL